MVVPPTVNTVASGFANPTGVAVDRAGNVFVADSNNSAVKEILAVNGVVSSNSPVITIGSGFSIPTEVTVDDAGNVFVADSNNNAVKEILAVNGEVSSSSTVITVGSGFGAPYALAVDSSGNVFVADQLHNLVKEIVAVNGTFSSSSTVLTIASGFSTDLGLAVDNLGNLFVADYGTSTIKKFAFATLPSLSFASTAVGSTSSDSPQTITITNRGNRPLTFEVPLSGLNPSLSANFTFGNSSTCPQLSTTSTAALLAPQTSCAAVISFQPTTVGSITGLLVATDDNLNALSPSYATQSVTLTGTATSSPPVAMTAITARFLTVGYPATAFTPVTATGGTGTLTYSVSPALPAGLSFSSAGVVSGTPTTITAASTYTVTVTDTNGATGTATFSLMVNSLVTASTTAAFTVLAQNHATTAFSPVTATGGTGTLSFSVSPALPAGLALSSTGVLSGTPTVVNPAVTYTVTVTDTNGATATATFSLTVSPATTTATAITSSSLTPTYGAMVVLTATITPAPMDTPPGTMSFYTGSSLLGTVPLNSSGFATLSIALPLGTNVMTATYSGSSHYGGSTSPTLSVSDRADSSVSFSASPTTQLFNNPIVLTAQAASSTAGTLTGMVSFLDGTTVIATIPLDVNGHATYSTTTLADGNHHLTASYSGDANFQPSGSRGAAVAITVADVNLDLGGDQNQSVVPGAAVDYKFHSRR